MTKTDLPFADSSMKTDVCLIVHSVSVPTSQNAESVFITQTSQYS